MIGRTLDRYGDLGLLILRIGLGFGFIWWHGWPKLSGGVERWAGTGGAIENFGIGFAHQWWGLAAALAESVGGLLIILGLFFRPALAAVFIVMVVAFTNHVVTGRGTPGHAFKNAWVLAGLFLIGPGKYSLDHWLFRRRAGAGPRAGAGGGTADR